MSNSFINISEIDYKPEEKAPKAIKGQSEVLHKQVVVREKNNIKSKKRSVAQTSSARE